MMQRDDKCNIMDIVKMDADNVAVVAQIEVECFSKPWSEDMLKSELHNPNSYFIVAKLNDKILGYAGMNTVLDEAYITNIAVLKEYRNNGVGKALINNLIKYVTDNDFSFITLEVRESNVAAIGLYSLFGFIKEGKRRNFYTKPLEDAIIMTRHLK